ncbi:MAG: penicillin-binding protein 1C [Bacteroidetes bacterium]|nr:penicillin-binding protein 1C [Bacteroidota bacterium]
MSARPKLRHWSRFLLYSILSVFISFLILDLLLPFRPAISYSTLVLDKEDNLLHAFLSPDQKWRMNCRLDEVSPLLVKTILYKEDKWFRYHPGINPVAVLRAAWQNISRGERVSGASTITMQVVRLIEPRSRTHLNKIIEMFRALQLEWHFSKDEILTMYLNLLPYGGNIEGIKAASYLYFGQKPQALSSAQILTLAIIPNNPRHLRLGVANPRIKEERNLWLSRLSISGSIPQSELASALIEPLNVHRLEAPQKVPHYALLLKNLYPGKKELKTSIDQEIQVKVENLVTDEIGRLRSLGIGNTAVIVVNNHNHKIIAYAGSAGFSEREFEGQVDGASALRSPGSALKPFLYAMAIDHGLITPRTMLSDIPSNFGGYRPQNYDKVFHGQLPASQALELSLNVPAVDLANRMGIDLFINKLSQGGLHWVESRKKSLGLSVVLGGCGVTLTELTSLYTTLANSGIHFPLQYLRDMDYSGADTLFSPEATWLITDMLSNLKRPDLPNNFESSIHLPHIAWKTGTSYGRRDAWSIGYNPEFTVGIWVGNFNGSGDPELSGSESATPLLFRIFNILMFNQQSRWFLQPKNLDYRLVCSESGSPPNDFCTNLVMDYYIPSISPNRKCNHLVEVFTNPSGTISYCRSCLPESGYRSDFYPNLPSSLVTFYELEQVPFKHIPPHNPECNRIYKDENPVITSLNDGKEYILDSGSKQQLQMACSAAADVSRVYWYVNNKYFGSGLVNDKLFFTPVPGPVKISCCDDKGRNSDIYIKVTFL